MTASYPNLNGQTIMVTTTVQPRRTIAVDFDGVLHQWDGLWKGYHVIEGTPTVGAMAWLDTIVHDYDIVVFTVRGNSWRGRRAVKKWLAKWSFMEPHKLRQIKVTAKKPPALVYLDDRAMRFDGKNWPSAERIRGARPWWKS
jgi:hypothetical protein